MNKVICEKKSTLRLVFVIFRHGRRTPILSNFALDEVEWPSHWVETDLPETEFEYKLENIMPFPKILSRSIFDDAYLKYGQLKGGSYHGLLTTFGQKDSYELGQKLRKKYIDEHKLVPSIYSNEHVRPYSTYMKRTVKSMKCFLAGMFEKKQSEIATIYSMPNETEYHFPNYHSCLLYKTFYHTAVELEDEIAHIKLLKKSIAEKLEKSVDKLPNPIDLYEEMYALQSHGFELPQKYKEHYYNVRDSAAEIYEYRAFDCRPLAMKLAVGLFIDEIVTTIQNKIDDRTIPSLNLYCAHDSTLMCLMKAMGCYNREWPDTSSYISLELHNIDNNWFVRLLYNDKTLQMKESENGFTSVENFYSIVAPYKVCEQSFKKMCEQQN